MKCLTRRGFLKRAAVLGPPALLSAYGAGVEPYMLHVNTYRIAVPHLPPAFRGFRMVQLTDLHYGMLMPLAHIRHVIRHVNGIPCDAIVCTGDYVHQRRTALGIDEVWPLLAELHAPAGVYAVLGNHDHWADTRRSMYWLEQTGFNLHRKAVPIERKGQRLWLAGAGDHWMDPTGLDTLLKDIPEPECRIVLAHNPDTADTPHDTRCDLFMSGHTHGGQVVLPFYGPPILLVRNKNYSQGLRLSPRKEAVFIAKGVGCAIFPVRFNCAPEIAVLELAPA